jgi:hypothetical protein
MVTASAEVGVDAEPAAPPDVVAQIAPFQLPEVTAKRCPKILPADSNSKNAAVIRFRFITGVLQY